MEKQVLELPKLKIKASIKSPRKLIIFSKPKTGKSSALAALENSLILDFEGGTDFLDAVKLKIHDLNELKEVGDLIIKSGKPYKYIIVDTITKLEEMCLGLALKMYKGTPMGSSFTGSNVLTLPNGAGYLYIREAVERTLQYIDTLGDRIIYSGHIKLKSLEKNGKEVQASDLDLIGKIKSMLSAESDAIGLLYREGNKNILTFKTSDDVICGARPEYLRNQDIVLSELKADGKLQVNWDKIYID